MNDKQITINILNELNNLIEDMNLKHKKLVDNLSKSLVLDNKIFANEKLNIIKKENEKINNQIKNEIIPKIQQYN